MRGTRAYGVFGDPCQTSHAARAGGCRSDRADAQGRGDRRRHEPTSLTQAILLIEGAKHRRPDLLKGVNQLSKFLAVRTPHLLATLAMVPYGIGRFASVFRSGKAYLTINLNSQPHCQYGTTKGSPMSTDRNSPYLGGQCPTEPWRGAAHAPAPLGR